jgi:flagellar hook-associated protein 2
MAIRVSGLNSGLDTEAIVSALVSSYSVKKNQN